MKRLPAIWVVRHGETDWSAAGKHTGSTDVSLNVRGRSQARELGRGIDRTGIHFAAVFTSPLTRARETAGLAGFPKAKTLPLLREWDYGEFEGRTSADIRHEQGRDWIIWNADIQHGENLHNVGQRADDAIEQLIQTDGNVLVFAHGHLLRILASRWTGFPAAAGQRLALDTGTISKLGYEHEYRVIAFWNAPVTWSVRVP